MKTNEERLSEHKHFIKYLRAIEPDWVIPALDKALSLKLIGKKDYKLILKEVVDNGRE